jgi:uncharacterized protein (TIGR03437 family)
MRTPRAIGLLFLLPCVLLAQPDRITAPIDARGTVVLKGNVHPMAQPQFDQGPVEPAFRLGYVTLMLKKTDAQQAALERLLEEQQNPASPNYHDWLTPEQYADRFGLSQNDLDQVSAWLQSEGFTAEYTARGRNWLAFSGTAGQVRAALHTEVHRYQVDGEMHFAAAVEPWVPSSLEPVVAGFVGLDDFYPKAPKHPLPAFTSGDGTHTLAPDDLATIYDITRLYQAGINGAGQSIVIVGQSRINSADIQGFRDTYKLPALSLQIKLNPNSSDPGTDTAAMQEADMDLEWAGAVAPSAALIYVYGRSADDAARYAIDNSLAPVISESFGSCESQATSQYSASSRSEAQKANALGITWLACSGDSGAFDCDYRVNVAVHGLAVNFPASIPEVTAVGGTEFNEAGGTYWNATNGPNGGSATSYIPETAWNDTVKSVADGKGIDATGGGVSSFYPKPAWQTGFGVPADGARDVPDVSLNASNFHDPYNVLTGGSWGGYGGTSISTPAFAGIVALLSQYLVANKAQSKSGVGNINPTLYQLAQTVPSAFHDVTAGDSIVPCAKGTPNCTTGQFGYSAAPGYDLATGLGSVDAYNLVTQWNSNLPIPTITATTTTVTASPTSITASGSTALTATVTAASGSATPTGSVTFTLGSQSLGAGNLSGSAGAATASLTVSASQLNTGNNVITASYGGSVGFGASSATVTVNVSASSGQPSSSMVLSSSPATVALIADYNHCSSQAPYYQQLNLQERGGSEVLLTRFLSGGNDNSSAIASWFGSWRLAPFGSLQANLCWNISSPPKTLAYEVDGTDTAGNTVTATLSVIFQSPANNPGALATSKSSVTMSASPSQSAAASVNVSVPSGQPWTVSVFPANQKTGWLAVSPLSGTGPTTVNLVAAAAGLANGAYTATLIFQSANTSPQFVNVPVTFTIGASSAISVGGVANGASYQHVYAPGMLVSVFGTNLAGTAQLASTLPLPLTMAGVSATVNGVAAPLLYVGPGQLNLQIPYETAAGTALLAVNNSGLVATYSFSVSASAPGLFTQNQSGTGPITATSSGGRGQTFALYVTGAGEVSPPVATGAGPAGTQVPVPLLPVSVTIGGVAAHLEYVGIPVWSVGTLQINFTVPTNAPGGSQPVVVTVGSASSPAAATFTVQ